MGSPTERTSSSAPKVKRLVPFAASFHFIFSSLLYSTPLPPLNPHPGKMAPMEKGFNWSNIAVGEFSFPVHPYPRIPDSGGEYPSRRIHLYMVIGS